MIIYHIYVIKPKLEYCPTIWDPYHAKYIYKIEMVQRRAARYVLRRYRNQSSVSDMLKELGWDPLADRRMKQRLIMMYKIRNHLVAIDGSEHLKPQLTQPSRHTNSQPYMIMCKDTDYQLYAFFPRTIRDWNSLPDSVVTAPSVDSFRSRLMAATN